MKPFHALSLLGALAIAGAPGTAQGAHEPSTSPAGALSAKDAPLAEYQDRLLELAFEAASRFPEDPHVKNRCRNQAVVVAAALELDQPERAHRYAAHVDDWRRGAAYADIAFHRVESGATEDVDHLLRMAQEVASRPLEEHEQRWRRDRIRSKIARVYAALGRLEQAKRIEATLLDGEAGRVAAVQASTLGSDELDEQLRELDGVVATGTLDQVRAALATYVQLFDRFYDDDERRELVVEKAAATGRKAPKQIWIETLLELADVSLERDDREEALERVEEAHALVEGGRWRPEHGIPLVAKVAVRRHRAGDEEKARGSVDAALARFERERERIYDVFRAETIQPVAEALQVMGDTKASLSVYRLAIEEASLNPNARPRCEDLVAACTSMAVHGVEPDQALWKRIRELRAGLVDPW